MLEAHQSSKHSTKSGSVNCFYKVLLFIVSVQTIDFCLSEEVENGEKLSITTKFASSLQPEENPTCRWNARTWSSTRTNRK